MKLQDYIHYYIGCRCFNTWFPIGHEEYDRNWVFSGYCPTYSSEGNPYYLENEDDVTWTDSIKLILNRLSDLPEKEGIEMFGNDRYWDIVCMEGKWDSFSSKEFHALIKQGYDLFGLCDAGIAVDAKTLK